jgi:hypothetical protein
VSQDDNRFLDQSFDRLSAIMQACGKATRITLPDGTGLVRQCSVGYNGIWPDDYLFPLLVCPDLQSRRELDGILALLTESSVDLPCLPDRVEFDGLPILSPGGYDRPHATRMPLHLPAAWVRVLSWYEEQRLVIPRKADWAEAFRRSVDTVPFSFGLAYVDPQIPCVGFGYFDTVAITGFELMSSLVLRRGLERAGTLFANDVDAKVLARWERLARSMATGIQKLWDPGIGGFVAGSKDCRQPGTWSNGLAYGAPGVTASQKESIAGFLLRNRDRLFRHGFTRQIVEDTGWQRLMPAASEGGYVSLGTYMNGGYWATGTGYVLPILWEHDRAFARALLEEMTDSLERFDVPEWSDAEGKRHGALKFLMSLAIPMLAIRAIREARPLVHYF